MCNENYEWHNVYMEKFTGNAPGYWTQKMFAEKMKSLERSRKAQKNPNFRRRARYTQLEKEMDYGEAAVEAAENAAREDTAIDCSTAMLMYQVKQYAVLI